MKNTVRKLFANICTLLIYIMSATVAAAQTLIPMPRQVEWGEAWLVRASSAPWRTDTVAGLPGEEAYRLEVTPAGVHIEAGAATGFLRARQTLTALSRGDSLRCCRIADWPEYAWRGAMLDVSRHFFPLAHLYRQVDLLARYKFNRLHLHLTDAAGWRIEIKRYPRLTQQGAWRTDASWKTWWAGDRRYADALTGHGGCYTQDELRALVRYAAERGVVVVPEIEMPAHSEEVLAAYPELSCTREPYGAADFCPGNDSVYTFLENVLDEVLDIFPSADIHIGGDEAGKAAWGDCTLCRRRMAEEGLSDVEELQGYFVRRMAAVLAAKGRRTVSWDETVGAGGFADAAQTAALGARPSIMIWRNPALARDAVRAGCDVVLSPASHCYFDYYQDAPPTQPEAAGGFVTLEKVYAFRPDEGLTADEARHVRGLQANLWAEYVPTPAAAEYMLWPRLLAISEIGWNGDSRAPFADFRRRALAETARLRAEGVQAFDLAAECGERPERSVPVRHMALGAPVKYNLPYHSVYAAAGDGALTDGLRGGWANNDGRWQGFIRGKRFDVEVDLGRRRRVRRVETTFMQACGPEIFYPETFVVSISADGEHWTELCRRSEPVRKTAQPDVRRYGWSGRVRGRFVRVEATAGAFGGWICCDEIEVD